MIFENYPLPANASCENTSNFGHIMLGDDSPAQVGRMTPEIVGHRPAINWLELVSLLQRFIQNKAPAVGGEEHFAARRQQCHCTVDQLWMIAHDVENVGHPGRVRKRWRV